MHKHELLEKLADDEHTMLVKDIVRNIILVPDHVSIPVLFEQLMEQREHIALALDAYGGLTGVVTIEEVMETLLGIEIVDEFDKSHDMQEYARQKWQERALKLGLIQEGDSSTMLSPAPPSV